MFVTLSHPVPEHYFNEEKDNKLLLKSWFADVKLYFLMKLINIKKPYLWLHRTALLLCEHDIDGNHVLSRSLAWREQDDTRWPLPPRLGKNFCSFLQSQKILHRGLGAG